MQPSRPVRPMATRVWVIEDDPTFREGLEDALNGTDDLFCDRSFDTAEACLEAARRPSHPDVLLVDVELPGRSGSEAVHDLARACPGTRILMLTFHTKPTLVWEALRGGAVGYLRKGLAGRDLLQAVRDVARGQSAMTPDVLRTVVEMIPRLDDPPSDYGLTERETDVLQELVKGSSKKRIARDLAVSESTVSTHRKSIYRKLDVRSATQAVARALSERIVDSGPA